MHVSRKLPLSVTLKNITSKLFSEEYKMRELEMSGEIGGAADDQTCFLPLFVLFTLFPGEKMSLNVFEPCYRLMIRRVHQIVSVDCCNLIPGHGRQQAIWNDSIVLSVSDWNLFKRD